MLEILNDSTDRILSIKISGTLSHEDYESFIPLIDAKVQSGKHLYLLADITEFESITPHALLDDFLAGMKYWWNFEAVAVVGNRKWEENLTKIGDFVSPVDLEYFDADQKKQARAWLEAQLRRP